MPEKDVCHKVRQNLLQSAAAFSCYKVRQKIVSSSSIYLRQNEQYLQ